MFKVRGGNVKGYEVSLKSRNNEQLKLIKFLHKIIKLPVYILASVSLFANSLTNDFLGIGMSIALMLLITILGNDIKILKNFSSYLC